MAKADWLPFAQKGAALLDERSYVASAASFEQAVAAGGDTWQLWADLAIATKHTGAFARCLDAASLAIAAGATDGDGVFWNQGVAATALGEWDTARSAWRRCGIPVPDGPGEVRMDLGPVPIRLEPRKDKETVWCERICPARAVIRSVPVTDHRCGDVLLHDGEPTGKLTSQGDSFSIFDELAVLERSARQTFLVEVTAKEAADRDALLAGLVKDGHVAEDWTGDLVFHCAQCARGAPHAHEGAWEAKRKVGIAATTDPGPALDAWLAVKRRGRKIHRLLEP